ncbi:tRNA (N6-isopentenyl adenosine(37)-C2)-methylthiotransferase MiaB [Acidaminobacter sp. JC074]|uniref:tRNA (N6-isopentenyl adenosine(37)-C2)-methylthiotransferase MiaB n=1 Tax=Acidaminobacter sp. JC074 TaxID=2530199 RepID=UPI001F0CE228|nr:tRNA (N6-isopentenyl adenosine(37)-C2)-methylthiotransferase MiaB [Acidaminobacter sp. JC074]MCH4888873.1 tRNA (N6-isopentenyl adenosine(37)-C2)-methylthiotransferase MiaB [Acidaminobacter sp. JC074]
MKLSKESKEILANNDQLIESIRHDNMAYFTTHGRKKKYLILTYGCQMNEHDSEKLAATLETMGYEATPFQTDADLILVNTCCVRENAELKVYGKIGTFKTLKEKNPDLIIGICGCMMQQDHVVQEIKKKYRHVDIVFGTHNVHNFPGLLNEAMTSKHSVVQVWDIDGEVIENTNSSRKFELKAFVNIMYGCNNFCTYCIVPYTRGRERSREKEAILDEIKTLVKDGTKEITLLGQNVNSYGKTLDNPVSFAELLEDVANIEGVKRLKFMTSHPKDLSKEVLEVMAKHDNISKYLHLPVQAASNTLLKSMNRGYTRKDYMEIIHYARNLMPEVTISTDLIIGFPGETDQDVEELLDLIKEVRYDSAFTFIYSQRKGTPADEMTNQIPDDIKHERFNNVLNSINEIIYEKNLACNDQVVQVLVEGHSKKDDTLTGRTDGNRTVHFLGDESLIGEFVNVRVTQPKKFSLYGELVEA